MGGSACCSNKDAKKLRNLNFNSEQNLTSFSNDGGVGSARETFVTDSGYANSSIRNSDKNYLKWRKMEAKNPNAIKKTGCCS